MQKAKFDIQGMTCSSCQAHVEKAVQKLAGVKKVQVNLLSNNMVVIYDEVILTKEAILQAVTDAGYGATIADQASQKQLKNIAPEEESVLLAMRKRLRISLVFWIPLMYLAMYHMFPIPPIVHDVFGGPQNAITFGLTQFLFLLPIVYVNRNYFIVGWKRLAKRTPNMDSLIAIGSSAAIFYGIYAIFKIGYGLGYQQMELVEKFAKDLYFESAGTILTLITVGKYLETKSKRKTGDAIRKLMNLAPQTATVLRDEKEIEVKVEEIMVGDVVVLKPGEGIPVDGVLIEGSSSVDQASITGESMPVEKTVGDLVISGTINQNGSFKMQATKVGQDTTLSQIIHLVQEAGNSKAPIARLADKVSGVFVPCVIGIAVFACIFWILQGQSLEFALRNRNCCFGNFVSMCFGIGHTSCDYGGNRKSGGIWYFN